MLGLSQNHIERVRADWVGELADADRRAREVTGFTQERGTASTSSCRTGDVEVEYLVGCDRRRSLIREEPASISRVGCDDELPLVAEVEWSDERGMGSPHRRLRTRAIDRLEKMGRGRVSC